MKKNKKISLQSGQVSRLLLVLAIVVLVAAVIVYLVTRMAERPSIPENPDIVVENLPIYEKTIGDIKFIFESSINHGNTLYASQAVDKDEDENLFTTENFIEVKVGAQNMGKINIEEDRWDIENIVDSEGREFVPLKGYSINSWLPEDDLCGELLKPSFDPTPCVKIYEVSKKSTGLKIRVVSGKDGDDVSDDLKDNDSALIDLLVQ
jgi:hypothetical protein